MKIIYTPIPVSAIWYHEPSQPYCPPAVILFTEGYCKEVAQKILGEWDKENSERFYNFKGGYLRTANGCFYAVKNGRTLADIRFSDNMKTGVKVLTEILKEIEKEEG